MVTLEQGIDYSWARPGGAAIKAAGMTFAFRYVPYQGDGGKGLTTDEVADLQANGIAIGLVFESTAGRPQGGRTNGLGDGVVARQGARSIGWPETLPIYFAVDYDSNDFAPIDEYLKGCAESLGALRVGVYGSFAVIEHCHTTGSAAWFWQTYAWSYGQKSQWRHVYQYDNGQTLNGGAVDYNEIYGEAGLWKVEEEMADPRVDKILAAMGGEAAVDAWNVNGNSLLAGYGIEQADQNVAEQKIEEHIKNHAAGVTGQVTEHTHQGGKVNR